MHRKILLKIKRYLRSDSNSPEIFPMIDHIIDMLSRILSLINKTIMTINELSDELYELYSAVIYTISLNRGMRKKLDKIRNARYSVTKFEEDTKQRLEYFLRMKTELRRS